MPWVLKAHHPADMKQFHRQCRNSQYPPCTKHILNPDSPNYIENNSGLSTVAICETIGESKMKVQAILKKYANEGIINYNITENGKEWFIVK